MQCGYCGAKFDARANAIYCGVNCRISANRRGQVHKPHRLDPVPKLPEPLPAKKRRCDYCRHWFQPGRPETRFCCAVCRVYWWRANKA